MVVSVKHQPFHLSFGNLAVNWSGSANGSLQIKKRQDSSCRSHINHITGGVVLDIQAKQIPVDKKSMTAEIDASNIKVIYMISEDGKVEAVPLPRYGILEISCQNYKAGSLAYRITLKKS